MSADALKRAAARAAVGMVTDGMLVGLGTGSTAAHAIDLLGARVREGLQFVGVPTSEASARQARGLGIPLQDSPADYPIDLTIDGADEIDEATLNVIKGLGGALLREKIVASTSKQLVIIADGSKLAPRLSGRVPVPVEVVTFGWESTRSRLGGLPGCHPKLRYDTDGAPFQTDGGNLVLDCFFDDLSDPAALERDLSMIVGVVETGLFIHLATTALVATEAGVRRIDRR